MRVRHFLQFKDFSLEELEHVFARTRWIKDRFKRYERYWPLEDRTLAMIFEKPSTRTRMSFEAGMHQLGGAAIYLYTRDSQLGRGESVEDAAQVISRMCDVIMVRTFEQDIIERFAGSSRVPVINGLTNEYHPCQILADVFTYLEHRGPIRGRTVAWIGDSNNVCNTWLQAAALFDFKLNVSTPPGYEVEPESYVFLETAEIERARPTPSRVIDLEHFVRLEEIDPVYFEKAYYVVPGPGAEKSYDLLLRTLKETGRVGIGRVVLRTKPHLVALRPMGQVLGLETLFFGDEVRDASRLVSGLGRDAVTQREIDVSKQLVEALAADWDPSQFADEYREELLRMIAERTPERIEEDPSVEPGSKRIEDLLEALRLSVEQAKAARKPKRRRRAG